ncbi:methyltransferase domain-containing protein [bacterium]|nr:methyltransferase domain-containing protein [bacterium]
MTAPLRVTWFIPGDHRNYNAMPASVWIRCLQIIPYLEPLGVNSTINDPAAPADVCVFVRRQDDAAFDLARRMKDRKIPVVFDLCANYFDETGLLEGVYGSTRERVREASRMAGLADAITCASTYIAERASRLHGVVRVFPDTVNFGHFNLRKNPADFVRPGLRAVWSGVSVKASDLRPILPILRKNKISLTIISDRRPDLDDPFEFLPWRYETFPRDILRGELCLAPRKTDNPYDLGHSHFKIGVFLAQGVPAIASPVPSYRDVLGAPPCGQLCEDAESWNRTIAAVTAERGMMAEWSRAALEKMKSHSTERIALEYRKFFETIGGTEGMEARRNLRRTEGRRLVYYSSAPTADFWDTHWQSAPLESYYSLAEAGNLGLLEEPFVRHLPRAGRIVEAGCGTGQYVLALRNRGYDAEGIEWSAGTVERIRARYPDLPVRAGDVTRLDVPDNSYDAYVSLGVVEHRQAGPEPFLREALRILRPGGVALISVPYLHPLRTVKSRLRFYAGDPAGLEFYQFAFSLPEFRHLVQAAGFTVVDTFYYDAVKGLKDEIPLLNRMLYSSRWGSLTSRMLRGALRRSGILRRCSHMVMLVGRKT